MKTPLFPPQRRFDISCLGRLAVDLYSQQIGARLEDATTFAKYLGGSSANIAFGAARLGLSVSMISRVGNEQMGNFLKETLLREGVDVSMVQTDAERLTALVLLGIKDKETFPLLFYRENCADMALDADGITLEHIAQSRSLLITGTHLSTAVVRKASLRALEYAKVSGTTCILDIDYRPVLWGLTSRGEGEKRYVANAEVTASLQKVLSQFDIIIGTEEEFFIAGGIAGDLFASLQKVRACTEAMLVVKLGAKGCCCIPAEVSENIIKTSTVAGENVEVLNVLGAGDAFAAGLLAGLLQGKDFMAAAQIANACGAFVVSRHACSAAMPTPQELAHWFASRTSASFIDIQNDPTLNRLHRVTTQRKAWDFLFVLAFDHRSQFIDLAHSCGANLSRLGHLKSLLLQAVRNTEEAEGIQNQVGILVDDRFGQDALAQATGKGWWIGRPVELPGSRPLVFEQGADRGSTLQSWPIEHTVKCLVYYHPEDEMALRQNQEETLCILWQACQKSGHELLLEIIPPVSEGNMAKDEAVIRTVTRLYNLGIQPEWWKLAPLQPESWQILRNIITSRDKYCRGVTILGLNQPLEKITESFKEVNFPLVKGFMVGRSIWETPSALWLQQKIDDKTFIQEVQRNFAYLIHAWQSSRKTNLGPKV